MRGYLRAQTNSSKVSATLGDELLVYLIDMAILYVRKKAVHLEDDAGQRSHMHEINSESAH